MCGFSFTFDNTEEFGIGRQVSDDIICLTAMMSLRKEIKTAVYHFNGDGGKRSASNSLLK